MALIHFTLKHPDNIAPWGEAPDTNIDWPALTEGEYWLEVNKATLYEYTQEVLANSPNNNSRYVDFQVVRLLEDLTSIFTPIAAPVPDAFYAIAREHNYLYRFYGAVQDWWENISNDATIDANDYYDSYNKAIEWIYSRTLPAAHLTFEPGISFFRNKNHMSIVWKADHLTDNNIPVWTAENGEMEMEYNSFVHEIEDFGNRFFQAMDTQVQIAVNKNWGTTHINKEQLILEQQARKAAFERSLSVLKSEPATHTDWEEINALITKMFG